MYCRAERCTPMERRACSMHRRGALRGLLTTHRGHAGEFFELA